MEHHAHVLAKLDARAPLGQVLQPNIRDVATARQGDSLQLWAFLHNVGKLPVSDAGVSDREPKQIAMQQGLVQPQGDLALLHQPAGVMSQTG